jgi:four helix bundle protein
MAQNYRDLIVWQKSMDLTVDIYKLAKSLPESEKYGLRSQMQRAASSIPMNIAEGYGRRKRGEYLQHLSYARGSLAELETQLILVSRLDMLDRDTIKPVWTQADEIGRMLLALMSKLSDPS